jgi:hypothetical protein
LTNPVAPNRMYTQVPNVLLEAMGPCFTLTVRRHQLAAPDLWRTACKQPKEYVCRSAVAHLLWMAIRFRWWIKSIDLLIIASSAYPNRTGSSRRR